MLQAGALEFGDALLDDGVPAVVGLDLKHVAFSLGDERVVVPGSEQRQLRARRRPDPAHDQPDLTGVPGVAGEDGERRLGDVGAGCLRRGQPVRDRLPGSVGDRVDRTRAPACPAGAVTENRRSNFAAVASTGLE
jgi:hypothetical protein